MLQLISQLKGFFGINPFLALSLTVGIFSSLAIPPTIGFFAKQTVLSAALQEGYYFLTLVGLLTSVVSAVYYLHLIKVLFFYNSDNLVSKNQVLNATFFSSCSSSLTITISLLTLIIALFIFSPTELFSIVGILTLSIFNSSLCAMVPIKIYDNANPPGENNPNYGKPRAEGAGSPSQIIQVTDIKNNTTICYDSINAAARALNINQSVIKMYFIRNQQKPYKGQYTFTKLIQTKDNQIDKYI